MTLSSLILCFITKKDPEEIGLIVISVTCILLWLLSNKLKNYLEILLVLFSLGFCISAFVFIKEKKVVPPMCFPAFFIGYIFGTYEKVITLKLPRIRFKLCFSLILLVAKILIFPAHKAVQIFSFFLQIVMIIFSLIADFLKDREDRKTFQNFYDYRESLTKFKNLLVSGLSTNLLILSRDLNEELFSNECLHKTISESGKAGKTYIRKLHEWLRHLKVDKRSATGSIKECPLFNQTTAQSSVLDLLKAARQRHSITGEDKTMSFSAEYIDEKAQCLKIYEVSITNIVWDAKDCIALILNDITAHSQNQSLKLADANKDKMLAMVSHELRTPINGILGVVRILQNQAKDPQTLQYLSICKSSGELLYNLVNSILDLQHLRDNKFSLKMTRSDLHELMRGVHGLFKFQFEEKGLALNLEVDSKAPKFIVTDYNRLRQILINLIGNALKFTFEGGVTITVEMDTENKDSNCIRFSVADTGIGIKEEDKAKLFKMYGRLDQANSTTNTQGVGFGLEISNRLSSLLSDPMNPSGIKCESEFGKGTKFSFSVKDFTQPDDIDNSQFFDPQAFAEENENLSLKMSPYSLSAMLTSERNSDLRQSQGKSPLIVSRAHSGQHLLPICPVPGLNKNSSHSPKASYFSPTQSPSKSRFQQFSSSCLLKSEVFLSSPGLPPKKENICSDHDRLFSSESGDIIKIKIPQKKQSILIIDDNSFNLLVAKHLLESLGYLVETALNGQLGVDLVKSFIAAKKNKFAAILMDLQMPVMDGYEATRVLKEMMGRNEIPDIPIIALSANDTEEDKLKCKKVGMYDHLSKPLKEQELKRLLSEVFDSSNSSFGSLSDVD